MHGLTWNPGQTFGTSTSSDGRFEIRREDPTGFVLYDFQGGSPIATGTPDECRTIAEAVAAPVELEYEPPSLYSDGLTTEQQQLVMGVRRVAQAGRRLETILAKRLPRSILELELSILTRHAADLTQLLQDPKL